MLSSVDSASSLEVHGGYGSKVLFTYQQAFAFCRLDLKVGLEMISLQTHGISGVLASWFSTYELSGFLIGLRPRGKVAKTFFAHPELVL